MSSRNAASQQAMQRDYYAQTASHYDEAHLAGWSEHDTALAFVQSMLPALGVRSVLDIGSGTGRALRTLKQACPQLRVIGVEPSAELRAQGHARGLSASELVAGDATHLEYADAAFDLVTEFGVLHHVPQPAKVVAEMLRVARVGVLISDANNFAQGSAPVRLLKQTLRSVGLWRAFDFVRTRGRGYMVSQADGVFYSYSVFDNFKQVAAACKHTYLLSSSPGGRDLYRAAPQVALLGLKVSPSQPSPQVR